MPTLTRSAIETSVRLSNATERYLHIPAELAIWHSFESEAAALIRALPDGAVVLDLGGGRKCYYARVVTPPGRVKLVAVDISPEELALNTEVAQTLVADVSKHLPMPDAS